MPGVYEPLLTLPALIGAPKKDLFAVQPSLKFRFADPLTYANGNLQDHTPWTYTFATCATLIGFMNGGGFLMQGDTVNNDWSAIFVGGKCPIARKFRIQVQFTGVGNTNVFRGGFGFVSSNSLTSVVLNSWIGPCVRRIVNGGAINGTVGGFTQGPCVTADNATWAASVAVGDTIGMVVTPLTATTYNAQYFQNGVLVLTRTETGGAGSVGLVPAFACSGFAGGGGQMKFNNVFVKEL